MKEPTIAELRAMLSLMATRILDLEKRVFDLETELHYADRKLTDKKCIQ